MLCITLFGYPIVVANCYGRIFVGILVVTAVVDVITIVMRVLLTFLHLRFIPWVLPLLVLYIVCMLLAILLSFMIVF